MEVHIKKKNWKPDETWEKELLERLVEEGTKLRILDVAQDAAIKLANALGDARHELEFDSPEEDVSSILRRVGRMAVLLDALQLLYGDAVEEEINFLQEIESALE